MVWLVLHACYFDLIMRSHIGTVELEIYTPYFEDVICSTVPSLSHLAKYRLPGYFAPKMVKTHIKEFT